MKKKIGKLYICPVINAMGPVTDPKHNDLLNNWAEINELMLKLFNTDYRNMYLDCSGKGIVFSWFFISWSGFKFNPVHRDFGWFNIYDFYKNNWGKQMEQFGDGLYWMYNHPAKSGIGNEWGLDWLENSHYLEILMRYVAERNYFPSVVEIVTEKNDTSHFLENFFPYDLGNRNSLDINWLALNADGKAMYEVIDWRQATHNWQIYSPDPANHQLGGCLNRKIGRLLDIKSVVYELKEFEIEKAFQSCLEGKDAMISAYEHDFRERSQIILEKFIEPVNRISKKYPEVLWLYKNSLDAFNLMSGVTDREQVNFEISIDSTGNLLIKSDRPIFGSTPFVFFAKNTTYSYVNPLRIGERAWLIYKNILEYDSILYVACNSRAGISTINFFELLKILKQK